MINIKLVLICHPRVNVLSAQMFGSPADHLRTIAFNYDARLIHLSLGRERVDKDTWHVGVPNITNLGHSILTECTMTRLSEAANISGCEPHFMNPRGAPGAYSRHLLSLCPI